MVEKNQLSLIRSKLTTKQTWNSLKEYHEKSTLENKVMLMRRICNTPLTENGDMESHLNEFSDLFQKLIDLGEQ